MNTKQTTQTPAEAARLYLDRVGVSWDAPQLEKLAALVIEVIRDEEEEMLESAYPEDIANEIADGCVPFYYSDLADVAGEVMRYQVSDPGLLDGADDVNKMVSATVWDILTQVAQLELAEMLELAEERKEAEEEEAEEELEKRQAEKEAEARAFDEEMRRRTGE